MPSINTEKNKGGHTQNMVSKFFVQGYTARRRSPLTCLGRKGDDCGGKYEK